MVSASKIWVVETMIYLSSHQQKNNVLCERYQPYLGSYSLLLLINEYSNV